MLCEVEGAIRGSQLTVRYRVTGKDLLEILSGKQAGEDLIDALARKLDKKRDEVSLDGSHYKQAPAGAFKRSARAEADVCDRKPAEWIPCSCPAPKCWRRYCVAVFKLKGRYCYVCGSKESIGIHHIIPRAEGGMNISENLMPLCPACHDYVECSAKKPRTDTDCILVGLERLKVLGKSNEN